MTFEHCSRMTLKLRALCGITLIVMILGISSPANAFPSVHTVTFNENASGIDSVTAFENGTASQPLTLIQNLSPSFADPGYLFEGWNTSMNGSGSAFADGATYPFNSDISLYAQWVAIPVVHTVTFNENDSALDSVTTYLSESIPTQLTSFASLQPAFSKPGYSFSNWNTEANGSGVSYADESQYSFSSDASLYAQWNLIPVIPVVHTVTFNENDSALDSVNTSMSSSSTTSFTPEANLLPMFVNASHTFSGWNTTRDGSGVSYADGAVFSFKADLVLFAQWTTKSIDTISFSANGGDGSVSSISVSPGSTYTVPNQTGLIRAGFILTNWNTSANGSGTKYLVGEQVTASESTLLYAQWSGYKPAVLFSAIGTFKRASSSLSPALKSQIIRLARTIKSRQFRTISLYGYSGETGLKSLNVALSRKRAQSVGTFLRHELALLRIRDVSISTAGEGAITGQSSNEYSRVEVFGV